MDSTFVNAIAELTRIGCGPQSIVENGERFFSTVPLHMLPKLEEPTPLKVHTLTALADYVQENRDALSLDRCMIHVVSPLCVTIHSNLMERSQRFSYLMAVVESPLREVLDTWLTPLQAIISLQTLFVPEGDHATVLGLLGSLADTSEIANEDDGFSQKVTTRAGVKVMKGDAVKVPNPVTLAPFRTFADIEQPASPFLFRMESSGLGVRVALFQADGGRWKLDAISRIGSFLADKLPKDVAILT